MFKDLFKNYIYPIAVFSAGMIGVGFMSLPYIAMKSGIWVVFGYFLAIAALIIVINLIFSDISLKTPDFKRFPGFADYYLGRWGKFLALIISIFGGLTTLLVYLVVGGEFLTGALQPIFSGNVLTYTFIYFLVASIFVYLGIRVIAKVEFFVLILLFLSIFFIFIKGFFQIKISNFISAPPLSLSNLFLPYSPILFALWGAGLIPQVEEMLAKEKKLVKKVVVISTLIGAVFYFLFTILILGITGTQTTDTALLGLKNFLGDGVMIISLFAGFSATFIAFMASALLVKETLIYDLDIKKWQASVITCVTPMVFLLMGFKSFIPLLSFSGGVLLGIDGVLILMMYKKTGGKNIIIYPLAFVFLFGVIYEIIYFIK
jgi:amino acid permease